MWTSRRGTDTATVTWKDGKHEVNSPLVVTDGSENRSTAVKVATMYMRQEATVVHAWACGAE